MDRGLKIADYASLVVADDIGESAGGISLPLGEWASDRMDKNRLADATANSWNIFVWHLEKVDMDDGEDD